MSLETMAESSTRYARETTRAEWIWRVVAIGLMGLVLTIPIRAMADEQTPETTIEFDIPQQRADLALTQFAEQANLTLLFPFEGVRDRTANALTGEYTLDEAIEALLAGTGLTPTFKNALVLDIAIDSDPTVDEDGMNTKKKAGLVAVLAGVLAGGVSAQEVAVDEQESLRSVVTGRVVDARTGVNLKGAKVTIEETGQWTSTGDLGEFRFSNIEAGSYTLSVSFLGYAHESVTIAPVDGLPVSEVITLRGGSGLEEIIVYGQRSARAQALNIERTAPNSMTVLSADQLGAFNGTTISEALRRAPGVAFVPDGDTGDGRNIIVRGLEPDLNQVQLNGIRLLDGTGEGRSPDLSTLLTEAIDTVTIKTSLLPSDDTNGAGGLVEIETKSPLDRPEKFASLGVEYGESGNDFGDDFLVNGTLSRAFGPRRDFGLSLSASYRGRETTQVNYALDTLQFSEFGAVDLPLGAGSPLVNLTGGAVNPLDVFPFDGGGSEVYARGSSASLQTVDDETLLVIGSAQKLVGSHSDLRFDVTYTERNQSRYSAATNFATEANYVVGPVDEFGGQVSRYLTVEDPFEGNPFADFFGTGIVGNAIRTAEYAPDDTSETLSINFRGTTDIKSWSLNYSAGYTDSSTNSVGSTSLTIAPVGSESTGIVGNFALDPSLLSGRARANTNNGRVVSIFDPLIPGADGQFVLPSLSPEGFAFFNTLDGLTLEDFRTSTPSEGEGGAITLAGSLRRDFVDSPLSYIEVGFNYQDTEFENRRGLGVRRTFRPTANVLLSDLGLEFGQGLLGTVGAENDLAALSQGSVLSVFANSQTLVDNGLLTVSESELTEDAGVLGLTGFNQTGEETLAGYLQARFDIGKLEVIGGVRVERLELSSTFFDGPRLFNGPFLDIELFEELGQRRSDSISQTDVLPRIQANYRINEDMLIRSSFYTTVSRPQLENLTQERSYLRTVPSPPFTQDRLRVTAGNPDLKPSTTLNFGLGWEWYTGSVGVIKVNGFYKTIENPLQDVRITGGSELVADDVSLPDIPEFQPTDATDVLITIPRNGDEDWDLYGVELVFERQFDFLPGVWSGLGIIVNATFTESSSERQIENFFLDEPITLDDIPFNGSPEYSGTFGLTYNQYGFDASLFYSVQDRRLASFQGFGLSRFDEEIDSLDLRIDYLTEFNGSTVRFFVRGNDLLKGDDDPFLETTTGGQFGSPSYYDGARFFGGRSFYTGVNISFL